MASLSSCIFPLEIISLILDELLYGCDYDDLLSCRLVCKVFENLATPHAFRVLVLSEHEDSRVAFFNIVENSQLAHLVKIIDFIYEDHETNDNDRFGDHRDDEEIRKISDIFSNIHRLPNLKTLLCDFPDSFPNCDSIDDGTSRCLSLQMRMFEKFGECYSTSAPQGANGSSITTANPRGVGKGLDTPLLIQNKFQLRSLKLDGILPVAHSEGKGLRSTGPGLPGFFQSIRAISVDLRVEEDNETFYENDPYLDFWRIDMRNLMSMTTSSLTSLSLFNNVRTVGFDCPTWDSLAFPNLLRLHLSAIVFNDQNFFNQQETGVEAFILRHAPTLQVLVLSDFLINLGPKPPIVPVTPKARTWDNIFQSLNEKLAVKEFTFTPNPELAPNEVYVHWYDGSYI